MKRVLLSLMVIGAISAGSSLFTAAASHGRSSGSSSGTSTGSSLFASRPRSDAAASRGKRESIT
jgi:hypothetical protein